MSDSFFDTNLVEEWNNHGLKNSNYNPGKKQKKIFKAHDGFKKMHPK